MVTQSWDVDNNDLKKHARTNGGNANHYHAPESAHSLTWELLSVQDEQDAKAGASYSSRVDTMQLKRITRV